MLAVLDRIDCTVRTDEAARYVRRHRGIAHFLLLVNGPETMILVGDRPWTSDEGKRLARLKGYARVLGVNKHDTFEYALTGGDRYEPVARRQLAVVA